MPRNDLRANEKRWQRMHLFREQRPHSSSRIIALLVFLAAITFFAWWLKIPLFDYLSEQLL